MNEYKIKEQFLGLCITKKVFVLNAQVTFDTTKEYAQEELASYYRLEEFKEFFDYTPEFKLPTYQDIVIENIKTINIEENNTIEIINITNEKQEEPKPKRGRKTSKK